MNNNVNNNSHIYYHDAYQIYELLDNSTKYGGYDDLGGLDSRAMKELFIRLPFESKRKFLYGQTLLHKCFESLSWTGTGTGTRTGTGAIAAAHTSASTQSDIVNVLLDVYPEAIRKEDENGYLPIHCLLLPPPTRTYTACATTTTSSSSVTRYNNSYHYIKELLPQICLAFPDSIAVKTKIDGQLPLHIVCQRTNDIQSESDTENKNESKETEIDTTIKNDNNSDNNYNYNHRNSNSSASASGSILLVDVIDYIITCYPAACYCKDNYGKYPFDYALEAIQNTNTNNGTITIGGGGGRTSSATTTLAGIQILQLLIAQNPILLSFPSSASSSSSGSGEFDSSTTCTTGNTASDNTTVNDNDNDNDTTTTRGGGDDLPLHRIIKKCSLLQRREQLYEQVINTLLEGFEGILRIQDSNYQTPLQLACTRNNPLSQIYTLVRKWPEQILGGSQSQSTIIFDDTQFNGQLLYPSLLGSTMITSIGTSSSSSGIKLSHVQKWMDYNPNIQFIKDQHGRLPIHYAVLSTSQDAFQIVEYLLLNTTNSTTRSLGGGGGEGRSVDNHATTNYDYNNTNTDIAIQQLSTSDNNGRLPLHNAAASPTCSEQIIQLLIDLYPDGLLQKDYGSQSDNNKNSNNKKNESSEIIGSQEEDDDDDYDNEYENDGRLPWHYGECSRQDLVFEQTTTLYPTHTECNIYLVPDEIQWDILSVQGH